EIARQKDYWLEAFSDPCSALDLPTDFTRPLVRKHAGATVSFQIGEDETLALKKLAATEGTTMYMVVLSLFNVLLSKLSNQEDIVIGTPTAGRPHPDVEDMIGMFVNTLPLRNYPTGSLTFMEFLKEVSSSTVSAFDNQSYPYEELVDELKLTRDTSRNPLFDTMFSWQNFEESELVMSDLKVTAHSNEMEVAKFDLTLGALEDAGEIYLGLQYATDLFKENTIERFADYFKMIVTAIAGNPNQKICDIEIVSKEEAQQLLRQADNTGVAFPREETLQSLFEKQVALHPEKTALVCDDVALTYTELNARSNRLAWLLREKGVQRGELVGLLTGRGIETVVGMLAILKAGGAYLPIDVDYPEERKRYMITDSGIRLVLTTQGTDLQSCGDVPIIYLEESANTAHKDSVIDHINEPSDLCYVIYTSGTTGNPKGVMVNHTNVVRLLFNDGFQYDFDENDVWPMFHSHCFDVSVWEMYGSLLYGGKLVVVPKRVAMDTALFLDLLKNEGVTILNQTPSAFYYLLRQEQLSEKSELNLRFVIFAGEALAPASLKTWKERYPATRLINMYGITETTVHSTFKEIGEEEIRDNVSNVGKPLPTLSIYVLDQQQNLVPNGVVGELYVGGDGVTMGYLGKEELTRQRFIQNPHQPEERVYRSGDLARFTTSGDLEYMGRIDHQVKIRGFRIELGEIEHQLLTHQHINEVSVLVGEKDGDKYLKAYHVASEELGATELRAYLADKLPDYMIPSYFTQLERMPMTSNGKLDRRALPEPVIVDEVAYEAAVNELEEQLVIIWSDILGLEADKVSVTANFFEIGGHSLKATIMINRVSKLLSVQIPLVEFFVSPTIRGLAEKINKMGQQQNKAQDKALISLKSCPESDLHLFFIHDISGDIQAYIETCKYLNGFNCWGIRSAPLDQYRLEDCTIEKIATRAIECMETIQPSGPYHLAGFSFGGLVTHEIANQLEQRGDQVAELILLDAVYSMYEETDPALQEKLLLNQKVNLEVFLSEIPTEIEETKTTEELWGRLENFLHNNAEVMEKVKTIIPMYHQESITGFDQISVVDLIHCFQVLEGWLSAMMQYHPHGNLHTNCNYIKAKQTEFDVSLLLDSFWKGLTIDHIDTDHYTLMTKTHAFTVAEAIQRVMKGNGIQMTDQNK
ncbi:MAG: amino acid adenylation domain-containing protein, partial [Bacteroidota bacterium]